MRSREGVNTFWPASDVMRNAFNKMKLTTVKIHFYNCIFGFKGIGEGF